MVARKVPRGCYPELVRRYKAGESPANIGKDFDAGYQCIYGILRKMRVIVKRERPSEGRITEAKRTKRKKPQPTYKDQTVQAIDPAIKHLAMSRNGQGRMPLKLPPLTIGGARGST